MNNNSPKLVRNPGVVVVAVAGTFYISVTIAPRNRAMLRDDPIWSADRPHRSIRARVGMAGRLAREGPGERGITSSPRPSLPPGCGGEGERAGVFPAWASRGETEFVVEYD